MIVPNLGVDEQLHIADAPFDQSSGVEASATVGFGRLVIQTIEAVRRRGFLRDVQFVEFGEFHFLQLVLQRILRSPDYLARQASSAVLTKLLSQFDA